METVETVETVVNGGRAWKCKKAKRTTPPHLLLYGSTAEEREREREIKEKQNTNDDVVDVGAIREAPESMTQ